MSVLTKTAVDVFAPQDSTGSARSVINQDAQVWGTEIERSISDTADQLRAEVDDTAEALRQEMDDVRDLATIEAQWKEPVRIAVSTNVNIANGLENGDVVGGVTLVTGNRVLLFGQTAAAENGIRVVPTSGAAARSTDANAADELLGLTVFVKEGTLAGKSYRLTTAGPIVVDTTALAFTEVSDQSSLNANLADLGTRVDAIQQSVPLHLNLALEFADDITGVTFGGFQRDGQFIARDQNGVMFTLTPSGVANVPTTYDYSWDSAGTGNALVRPNDGRLRLFVVYGQSYGLGTVDAAYYASETPYNSVAFDPTYALMPSVGVAVPDDFTTLVGLKEQKNGNGVTVETICSEWVKGVHDGWALRGLAKAPIVAIVDGEGGRPVQRLMPGAPPFEALMLKVERVVKAAAAIGLRVVCDAVCYLQGQDNRSMPQTMTRYEWARAMETMQSALERRIRALTGQLEGVPMLLESISRGAKPAEISLGAAVAAARSPGKIVLLNPDYALEHYANGDHPAVPGYRRLGRYAAKATLGTVYGLDYRPMNVRRHWMQDSTHLRIEVEVPKGSTLIKDTSDALVKTTGLNAGSGILAYDKNGSVTISSTAVVANHPAANSDVCGTIEVTFSSAPDANSLVAQYANERPPGSGTGQGGLGGSVSGPRGLFRADGGYDAEAASDLVAAVNSWVQPFEIS